MFKAFIAASVSIAIGAVSSCITIPAYVVNPPTYVVDAYWIDTFPFDTYVIDTYEIDSYDYIVVTP